MRECKHDFQKIAKGYEIEACHLCDKTMREVELEQQLTELKEAGQNFVDACKHHGLKDLGFTINCAVNIMEQALQGGEKNEN